MKNLTTAIFAKMTSATDLYADIGGRMFKGEAPQGSEYPYIIYRIISDVPDDVFVKKGEIVVIQFSIYSSNSSSSEIEDIYTHLKALYDECSFTISGSALIWMRRQDAILMVEEEETPEIGHVWHYAVDYEITTEAS